MLEESYVVVWTSGSGLLAESPDANQLFVVSQEL